MKNIRTYFTRIKITFFIKHAVIWQIVFVAHRRDLPLIEQQRRIVDIAVIARNSDFQYKGKAVDVRRVGKELGATYVVEGSVRRSGDRIRVTAQLLDATDGSHLWAETYRS